MSRLLTLLRANDPRWTWRSAQEVVQQLRWVAHGELSAWRQRQAERQLWANVRDLAELRELMAQFCEGKLWAWPGHLGPRDPETVEIGDALAHANRAGFLTTGSQPGVSDPMGDEDGSIADCGALWEQRAAVEGFATAEVAYRLDDLVGDTAELKIQFGWARNVRWWRRYGFEHVVSVTRVNGDGHTHFGAEVGCRGIRWMFSGVPSPMDRQLQDLVQVFIYDPRWGEHDLLWERLAKL